MIAVDAGLRLTPGEGGGDTVFGYQDRGQLPVLLATADRAAAD